MKKVIYVFICLFFIFAIGTISCQMFGYDYYVVISDSMHPAIPKYSLVYIKKDAKEINIGDVIAFNGDDMPILHRVIDVDGNIYTTHGDHNPEGSIENVAFNNIIGKMIFHIPYIGLLFINQYFWIIMALVICGLIIVRNIIKEMKNRG
ncbi:MAG TPA: signal peptidase I [Bacilli bacterium]